MKEGKRVTLEQLAELIKNTAGDFMFYIEFGEEETEDGTVK